MSNADPWEPPPDDEPPYPEALAPVEDDHESVTSFARSWLPIDPTPVLDGTWTPPEPTIGLRADKIGLLYPGKVHTASGETEGGKTWFALSIALDELTAGAHVLYLDFEDDFGGVGGRLKLLQVANKTIEERFHYVRPLDPIGNGIHRDDLRRTITSFQPTVVMIDGITEAMTLHGLNPLDNADAAAFGRMLPRWLANHGPAVLSLDHVTKDREGRSKYAIGAVHKLNALDGAAFLIENRQPFGVGLTGRSTVKIAKDRPGQLRRHALPNSNGTHWFGDLVLESHGDDFAEVTIEPPRERNENFRPTHLMEKLWKLIDNHQGVAAGISGRALQAVAKGNAANNRQALAFLELGGYVTAAPYRTLKPYPPEEDPS